VASPKLAVRLIPEPPNPKRTWQAESRLLRKAGS